MIFSGECFTTYSTSHVKDSSLIADPITCAILVITERTKIWAFETGGYLAKCQEKQRYLRENEVSLNIRQSRSNSQIVLLFVQLIGFVD
jgi:hypothetical protein